MPFIYIDSQGREVKIPSVDALRLRIELGAIRDQTQFHDENTGRWAEAVDHDIYRTLKRELDALESGFVAPPPPAPSESPGASPPAPERPATPPPADSVDEAVTSEPTPSGLDVSGSDPGDGDSGSGTLPGAEADPADPLAMDLGLTPPEVLRQPDPDPPAPETAATEEDDEEDDGFGTGPLWDDDPDLGTEEPAAPASPAVESTEGVGADPEPGSAPRESFVASAEEELMGSVPESSGAGVDADPGLSLEPSLAESFDAKPIQPVDGAVSDGLDDVPSWMETPAEEPRESAGGPSDGWGGAVPVDAPADDWTAAPQPEPAPRPRSAPPPRTLTKARSPGAQGVAGLVLMVVVLGAAAFFGWRYAAPLLGGAGGGDEPEVALPALDEALRPQMEELAGRAVSGLSRGLLALPERRGIPGEPTRDWLAGIYLANASDYPNVPAYWEAVREWTDAAQAAELNLFREAYRSEVDGAGLDAPDAEAVRNRGLAGFQAAGTDRRAVYDQLRAVADRSLALHEFLVMNEDQVAYEPAGSGVSRDPVLEAVPANEVLGDAMWDRVGSITNALDALGYLDQIDTDRLLGAFLEKLEASAVR
ncbi:MAG TPA: hypothetical protein VK858_02895 [Longimicrobiales bacterium]|nr:hypothetical protein [Longimicrobiales bacterium]